MMMNEPTFIIAEAGTAHDGEVKQALSLVQAAASAGADAVKFQLYQDASFLLPSEQDKADWFNARRLSRGAWFNVQARARDCGIEFMASAFDAESIDFLIELGVKRFKVASRTLRDDPKLLGYLAKKVGKDSPVYISFGMVDAEKELIYHLYEQFDNLTILHCVSEYPTFPENAKLERIKHIDRLTSCVPIGYSDHTVGIIAPIAAVALGAMVIEKHIRLEPGNPQHPDYACSLNPDEFAKMVSSIREVERML